MIPSDARALVFIDASVWIAASGSPAGGSSLVLDICCGKHFAALCSQRVLLEAQTNIRNKLSTEALVRFYQLLAVLSPASVPPVSPEDEARYLSITSPKDAHVIASAVAGGATYVITLDRKHLANEQVRAAGLPFRVLLPGEFIHFVLADPQIS